MFDPDAGHRPTLRLDAPPRKDPHAERAEIRRQIDALWVRYCDLVMESDTEMAQSRPISVSDNEPKHFEGFEPSVSVEQLTNLMELGLSITDARMVGKSAVLTADVLKAAELSSDNDFWTHRHRAEHDTRVHQHAPRYDQARVMGGHRAKVARVDGATERA